MPVKKSPPRYSDEEIEYLKKMGDYLRSLRLSRHFSQEAFADAIGVHRTYMGSIERGEQCIGFLNLLKIVKKLEPTDSELLAFFHL